MSSTSPSVPDLPAIELHHLATVPPRRLSIDTTRDSSAAKTFEQSAKTATSKHPDDAMTAREGMPGSRGQSSSAATALRSGWENSKLVTSFGLSTKRTERLEALGEEVLKEIGKGNLPGSRKWQKHFAFDDLSERYKQDCLTEIFSRYLVQMKKTPFQFATHPGSHAENTRSLSLKVAASMVNTGFADPAGEVDEESLRHAFSALACAAEEERALGEHTIKDRLGNVNAVLAFYKDPIVYQTLKKRDRGWRQTLHQSLSKSFNVSWWQTLDEWDRDGDWEGPLDLGRMLQDATSLLQQYGESLTGSRRSTDEAKDSRLKDYLGDGSTNSLRLLIGSMIDQERNLRCPSEASISSAPADNAASPRERSTGGSDVAMDIEAIARNLADWKNYYGHVRDNKQTVFNRLFAERHAFSDLTREIIAVPCATIRPLMRDLLVECLQMENGFRHPHRTREMVAFQTAVQNLLAIILLIERGVVRGKITAATSPERKFAERLAVSFRLLWAVMTTRMHERARERKAAAEEEEIEARSRVHRETPTQKPADVDMMSGALPE